MDLDFAVYELYIYVCVTVCVYSEVLENLPNANNENEP